jgi:DNA replication licensing factor MCM4
MPKLSDRAAARLTECYLEMRRAGSGSSGNKTVSATPRQLESLIRISEAFAKMKLSNYVD